MQHNTVFLIGFMGSGKSYWGNTWSLQAGIPFYDLDAVIETQQQKTIAQIFEEKGETHFRAIETVALENFAGNSNAIIACGGGTPCFNNNMKWMNSNGITIYLKASPGEIMMRVKNEQAQRTLIKNLQWEEISSFIEKKLEEREPFYSQAKYILPVSSLSQTTINNILTNQ